MVRPEDYLPISELKYGKKYDFKKGARGDLGTESCI